MCSVLAQYDLADPATSSSHPSPLFVHANLLKHLNSGFFANTNPFSIIKRPLDDVSNSRTLDNVRGFVYTTNGMCTDFELINNPKTEDMGGETQRIIEENFEEVQDGKFNGWYDQVYKKHGGKTGGW